MKVKNFIDYSLYSTKNKRKKMYSLNEIRNYKGITNGINTYAN